MPPFVRIRLAALAVAVATALRGERPALAGPEDEAAARELFAQGLARFDARDWEAALEKFRAAHARWQNPKILANVGSSLLELGRRAEAADAYRRFLEGAAGDDPQRDEVGRQLAELRSQIGTLRIEPGAPGARVTVGERAIAPDALDQVYVEPGEHRVVAERPDGLRRSRKLRVSAGETARVSFDWPAPPAQPGPGEPAESTPGPPPASGAPRIAAPADEAATRAQAPGAGPTPWIAGGLGVASLAVSGVLFALHSGKKRELEKRCLEDVCPAGTAGDIDGAESLGSWSAVTLAAGLAGAGVAVVLLATDGGPQASARPLELGLAGRPGGGHAALRGRF